MSSHILLAHLSSHDPTIASPPLLYPTIVLRALEPAAAGLTFAFGSNGTLAALSLTFAREATGPREKHDMSPSPPSQCNSHPVLGIIRSREPADLAFSVLFPQTLCPILFLEPLCSLVLLPQDLISYLSNERGKRSVNCTTEPLTTNPCDLRVLPTFRSEPTGPDSSNYPHRPQPTQKHF